MPLYIASLNSGSNGNCYYIGNDQEAVLVDAGISCREIEKRMKRLELEMEKVKAVFISHEHGDHITGVVALSRKYQLPVYITSATLTSSRLPLESSLAHSFLHEQPVSIGQLLVTPFRKAHDAADPHSFVVSSDGIHIGVLTDIGVCCAEVKKYFSKCQAVFLESNYCETMLENGRYPYHLKKRIRGGNGHLSNTEALDLFVRYRSRHLTHLILSHLSNNNNDADLVNRLFLEKAGDTNIVVASRYQESTIYKIDAVTSSAISLPAYTVEQFVPMQLSLF
ncbi:MBL fold metallo-hydrolase [Terrimonas sp. NA20]|uniref:MBL fold metallo-hydrolase n=1 Tax=Terrimonas ginsenosidimutans TaxID=2908004 RepID=A0ABS9KXF1_9BACT|nr:MBL fold metallo-hydrolase [Terrimonas ginsenosidimutans]MCG2617054.1 MBL fold metallo-hydrolase [Terrimonas ginsenosidimutans]